MAVETLHRQSGNPNQLTGDPIPTSQATAIYLDEIRQIPLLTVGEEIILARAHRESTGIIKRYSVNPPATDGQRADLVRATRIHDKSEGRLVESNLRLVASIAKRYAKTYPARNMPLSDLMQEGNMGLLQAVEKFDERLGNRFSTYATWWIRQGVSRAVNNQGRTIRLPIHTISDIGVMVRARENLALDLGREPTVEEIAANTNFTPDKVQELREFTDEPSSLDKPTGDDEDHTLIDTVPDSQALSPETISIQADRATKLRHILDSIPQREKAVLMLRFGVDCDKAHSLEEIGREMGGLSRERIRQLETRALRRLKNGPLRRRLEEAVL